MTDRRGTTRPDGHDEQPFQVIVHPGEAPGVGAGLVDVLQPAVRASRVGVLVSSRSVGRPGTVVVAAGVPGRTPRCAVRWVGRVTDDTTVRALCHWIGAGAPGDDVPSLLATSSGAVDRR